LDDKYYRPTPAQLLEEYLKAVDLLTINEENRLRKKVEVLKAKRDEIEMLKRQAQQKDDKLKTMEKQFNSMQSQLKSLLTAVTNMNDQNKVNEFAKTLFDSGIVKKG
jgi:seryl-tRNA synthetase